MDVFKLLGRIAIDNSDAMSGMDDAVKKAKDTESNLTKIFKKVGTVVVSAFAVDRIKEFGNACKEAYAEFAAEQSAFTQIMGEYAGEAQKKLEGVADSTGAVSTRMTKYMTSLTAKFKGLGYGVEDATDMASNGLKMAADAAAFWDMSIDESVAHLNSFINGSYEGGEAIGLFANDTQMAMYAVKRGLVATTKEWSALDEATKQATRLEYAQNMMETSGAMGQAAKEAGSLANVQANLTESWRKFKAVIGEPIVEKLVIPAMQKLNDLMPKLTESVTKGIDWIEQGFNKIASYFTKVFTEDGINLKALPEALQKMLGDVASSIPGLLSSVGKAIENGWNNTVWPAIQGLFKVMFGVELPSWSELSSIVSNWWNGDNGIKQGIASVCNWVLNLFGAPAEVTQDDVSKVLSDWWTNTVAFVKNACSWVLGLFGAPEETDGEKVTSPLTDWWKGVKTTVQNYCSWILQPFQKPEDLSQDSVVAIIGTWWGKTGRQIHDACIWTLKLFGVPTETAEQAAVTLNRWWLGIKGAITNACTWVLKLFSNPEEAASDAAATLTTWWDGVKAEIEKKCTWVMQLPSTEGLTALIEELWKYVSSGEAAKDATEFFSSAVDFLSGCIDGVIGFVASVVEKLTEFVEWLNSGTLESDLFKAAIVGITTSLTVLLAMLAAKTVYDNFITWINNIKAAFAALNAIMSANPIALVIILVAGLVAAIVYLWNTSEEFREFWTGLWEDLKTAVDTFCDGVKTFFTETLPQWWKDVREKIDGAAQAILGFFGINVPEDWSLTGEIAKKWGEVTSAIQVAIDKVLEFLGYKDQVYALKSAAESGYNTLKNNPEQAKENAKFNLGTLWNALINPGGKSNYVGLDYVPYDNYVSRLHKGEAVLTRTEAEAWRSGYGDTRRMEAILSNVENLLQVVAQNTGANKQIVLDSGALVGQLAPGMDAQLGTISNRKGRRN